MINLKVAPLCYAKKDCQIGIVHLGLGAFHRAHQAMYMHQYMQTTKDYNWAICSVNIRSNGTLVKQLKDANFIYHLTEYSDNSNVVLKPIHSIQDAIFAAPDSNLSKKDDVNENTALLKLLKLMSQAQVKIVSLTITEKGYLLKSITQPHLDDSHPHIVHDINHPQSPITAVGIIVEALKLRRKHGIAAFSILSCDNMPNNGDLTAIAVTEFASIVDKDLALWIKENVDFPSSMVDRIVPAMTTDNINKLNAQFKAELTQPDPIIIQSESYHQWVIEDKFRHGRPEFEKVGIIMTDDVSFFENMKLRMLNGSHTLLAFIGQLFGYSNVAEATNDKVLTKFIHHYMINEASTTLGTNVDVDLSLYAQELLNRFQNDSLEHKLSQIAMDSSQKIPQRWLKGVAHQLQHSQDIDCVCFGIAAWMKYIENAKISHTTLDDPMQEVLFAKIYADDKADLTSITNKVRHILSIEQIFDKTLATSAIFEKKIIQACIDFEKLGVIKTISNFVNNR